MDAAAPQLQAGIIYCSGLIAHYISKNNLKQGSCRFVVLYVAALTACPKSAYIGLPLTMHT